MKRPIVDVSFLQFWRGIEDTDSFKELLIKIYAALMNNPLPKNVATREYVYSGMSIFLPLGVYVKLCYLSAKLLENRGDNDCVFYYNKITAVSRLKMFSPIRDRFRDEIAEAAKHRISHYRPRYETLYGKSIASEMRARLSKSMKLHHERASASKLRYQLAQEDFAGK